MATNFPTSLDTLSSSRGTTGQPLSSPNHITHHTNEDDAITALETKVGVDSSAVATTLDYLLKSSSSSNPGHKHTFSSLSDFSVSSPSTGQFMTYNGSNWVNSLPNIKFGGTGADGALAITSGTTTIDCANAAVVIKNYTSISITSTAVLAFSNPNTSGTLVILKSQGNVTLISASTPMISLAGMGSAGGAGSSGAGASGKPGFVGGNGTAFIGTSGGGGLTTATGDGITGGTPGTAQSPVFTQDLTGKALKYMLGAGGGGSGGSSATAGSAGGNGGGGLIIECGAALNFTTAGGISVNGNNGVNGSGTNGGGGGGGAGSCIIVYNTLTSAAGTVTVAGGTGGTGGVTSGAASGGGGGGGSLTVGTVGSVGRSSGTTPSPVGGNGGTGFYFIVKNTEFA